MPDIPIPPFTDIDTEGGVSTVVKAALDAKYTDAGKWATYAASMLEYKLTAINTKADEFDISSFIEAAAAALANIPPYTDPETIDYTRPTAPPYDPIPPYAAPNPITFDTATYTAPSLRGTITDLPAPTVYNAGTAPSTAVSFNNPDFVDALLTTLRGKLENDLLTPSTGLGTAEAALFDRETARQNAARAASYTEITGSFSAKGFDMPPGALLAKQTEMNNESGIRLSDSSAQIMAESAKLAQSWNQTTLTASIQMLELLSRIFDSKIARDFEAAKTSVMMALEGFKAEIQVIIANADIEGKYLAALSNTNENIIKMFSSEVQAESTRMGAIAELNKAKSATFKAEVDGAIAAITAPTEVNKAMSAEYSARAQAEGDYSKAQGMRNEAMAAGREMESRKALAEAELAKSFAMSNIDAATRKYLGEIQVLQGTAQSMAAMTSAALNTVNVSASIGTTSGYSTTYDADINEKIALQETAIAAGQNPPSW